MSPLELIGLTFGALVISGAFLFGLTYYVFFLDTHRTNR